MTATDTKAFGEALYVLGEAFGEPVTALRAEAYFLALDDLPLEAIIAAMRVSMKTCRWFPKPVELREHLDGHQDTNGDLAWGDVLHEIRRVGYCGSPSFSDPRVLDVVRTVWGTWQQLCETLPGEGPELVGWMKQFKVTYETLTRRDAQPRVDRAVVLVAQRTMKAMPVGEPIQTDLEGRPMWRGAHAGEYGEADGEG